MEKLIFAQTMLVRKSNQHVGSKTEGHFIFLLFVVLCELLVYGVAQRLYNNVSIIMIFSIVVPYTERVNKRSKIQKKQYIEGVFSTSFKFNAAVVIYATYLLF